MLVESKFFGKDSKGELVVMGSKCKKCGKIYFPRKNICAACLENGTLVDHPLSKHGKLISYSVAHSSMLGIKAPYAFGYVMLPEDGIMIYTIFNDCEPFAEKLKLGMDMEMVLGTIYKNHAKVDIKGYMFRPVK